MLVLVGLSLMAWQGAIPPCVVRRPHAAPMLSQLGMCATPPQELLESEIASLQTAVAEKDAEYFAVLPGPSAAAQRTEIKQQRTLLEDELAAKQAALVQVTGRAAKCACRACDFASHRVSLRSPASSAARSVCCIPLRNIRRVYSRLAQTRLSAACVKRVPLLTE